MQDHEQDIEPIPAEEARAILEAAIEERLGKHWRDEETGWQRITGHDYMARLNRGSQNIDFYVDLLGKVRIEEKALDAGQENGRAIAWMVLGGSLVVAMVIARIAGYL